MKTFEQIVSEYSSYSSDERVLYLRSLTIEELESFKKRLHVMNNISSFYWTLLMIDNVIGEKISENRDKKINQIFN